MSTNLHEADIYTDMDYQELPSFLVKAAQAWDEIAGEEFEVSSDISPMDYISHTFADDH